MNESMERAAFVREGLLHYEKARQTINHFHGCIYDMLADGFAEREQWKHFHPRRLQGELQIGKAPGAVYLSSYIAGDLPERGNPGKAWLSAGIYWSAPLRRSASPVLSATCWLDGQQGSISFNQPRGLQHVLLGALYRRNERRLIIELTPDADIERLLADLLDAADEALGALVAAEQ